MKYCTHCGNQILNEAEVCPKCGCAVNEVKKVSNISDIEKSKIFQLIAKIFMLIALAGCFVDAIRTLLTSIWNVIGGGVFENTYKIIVSLIPLIWIIPMTIHYFKVTSRKQSVGLAFKVCTLIFVNLVAGVLMLCETNYKKS